MLKLIRIVIHLFNEECERQGNLDLQSSANPRDSAAYGVGPGLELAADRQRHSMNGKMEEKRVGAGLSGPQLGKLSQLRPEASGLLLPL